MKIAKGVEWASHTCALLALLPAGAALPLDALAEFIDVPPPYLAKQMQALSRANIVATKRGVKGGYRLARLPETLSLWDITAAIDGAAPSFRCSEVRRNGPCGASKSECKSLCPIADAFRHAEQIYRDSLAAVSLDQIVEAVGKEANQTRKLSIQQWVQQHATQPA